MSVLCIERNDFEDNLIFNNQTNWTKDSDQRIHYINIVRINYFLQNTFIY